MTAARPNLARRPFVDTRPANVAAAILLLVAAIVLTAVSVRTVHAYLDGLEEVAGGDRGRSGPRSTGSTPPGAERSRSSPASISRACEPSAEEANALARLRAFSWTRFLTRLEQALPERRPRRLHQPPAAEPKAIGRRGGPGNGADACTVGRRLPRHALARLARPRRPPEADPGLLRLAVVRRADSPLGGGRREGKRRGTDAQPRRPLPRPGGEAVSGAALGLPGPARPSSRSSSSSSPRTSPSSSPTGPSTTSVSGRSSPSRPSLEARRDAGASRARRRPRSPRAKLFDDPGGP